MQLATSLMVLVRQLAARQRLGFSVGVGGCSSVGWLVSSAGVGLTVNGSSHCLQAKARFWLVVWSAFHLVRCV